jgi:ubiquinone/menaquinone biosynthesis C-methylase UbiE
MYNQNYYQAHTDHYRNVILSTIPSFRWIKKSLGINQNDKVLDAGCGTGYLLDFVTVNKSQGYGIDISEFAVKTAQIKYSRLHFKAGDLTKIPFNNNYFDKVYAFNVIEHIVAQDKALEELHRVLKPGGTIVIGTNIKDSLSWFLFKLFLGGDPTHTREFSAPEFVDFVGKYFKVKDYVSSSCIARFHPFVNKIFHKYLKGDILVKAIK